MRPPTVRRYSLHEQSRLEAILEIAPWIVFSIVMAIVGIVVLTLTGVYYVCREILSAFLPPADR